MVAEPGVRVFDDHALQIIAMVSHCTNTELPVVPNKNIVMTGYLIM